ncbi:helix-turn-helix transcriptional regulator [Aquamicrobium defluvii]|uniref:AlpA family transcriptional regulator n=1 Tax=Aquamicrobium defluvii TaxID=69279 RepID=A0A4R6Y512_9HYPH|nr:AlpA family phage regulatory protein [Aquamicrobium defluvii]TDR30312.1 AlpA family transcriptional regulator [Aquamicrobium defluvii]
MSDHTTLITRDQLCALLGISDTTRQRLEKADPTFPPKLHISMRRVAYLRADAHAWLMRQREAASKQRFAA